VYTGLPQVSAPKHLHRSQASNTAPYNQAQGHCMALACVLLPLLLHTSTCLLTQRTAADPAKAAAAAAAAVNATKPRHSEDNQHCA
jgi:hypothetical protein